MRALTAGSREHAFGHAVAVRDRDRPTRLLDGRARLGEKRFRDRLHPPRCDAQPAAEASAARRANEELYPASIVGCISFRPSTMLDRLVSREQAFRIAGRRERLAGRRRDGSSCLRRGNHRNLLWNTLQGRGRGPSRALKARDGRPQERPCIPAVDEHAPLAARTTRCHHVVFTEQVRRRRPRAGAVRTARVSRRSVTTSSKLSIRSDLVITGKDSTSDSTTSCVSMPCRRSRCHGDRSTAVVSSAAQSVGSLAAQLCVGPIDASPNIADEFFIALDMALTRLLVVGKVFGHYFSRRERTACSRCVAAPASRTGHPRRIVM